MQLVAEQEFPDEMLPMQQPMPTATPSRTRSTESSAASRPENLAYRAAVIGAVNVLLRILSMRVILLISVVGGIGLAVVVLQQPDVLRLGVLGIYAVAIVIPVIWLASRR
jgi:hypothetical protein